MREIINSGAQGDVLFLRVDEIPGNATVIKHEKEIVVAHSETGHHHSIDAAGVIHFDIKDPLICYLRIDGDHADVVHHRSHDTHETIRLPRGFWQVRRQREYTPDDWHTRNISNVCERALNYHGEENQLRQLQEECAELIVSVNHFTRKRAEKSKLAEEMADVFIMLVQLSHVVNFEKAIKNKIKRLSDKLDALEKTERGEA